MSICPTLNMAIALFFGDEIETIETIEPVSGKRIASLDYAAIFPANLYVAPKDRLKGHHPHDRRRTPWTREIFHRRRPLHRSQTHQRKGQLRPGNDSWTGLLLRHWKLFPFWWRKMGTSVLSARLLSRRLPYDHWRKSRHTASGQRYVGRRQSQKTQSGQLRLPLAFGLDNRPLNFDEFQSVTNQVVYVSATPGDYELEQTEGVVVEQIVRPTGLLDPPSMCVPASTRSTISSTKSRSASKLKSAPLSPHSPNAWPRNSPNTSTKLNIKVRYIHSEVDTLDRVEIIRDLRLGVFDVLVGVNLLREGLDLPEVSLRSSAGCRQRRLPPQQPPLTQTAGRAARNSNGLVIFYADKITDSMQMTIDETNRRRAKQIEYNRSQQHHPHHCWQNQRRDSRPKSILDIRGAKSKAYVEPEIDTIAMTPSCNTWTKIKSKTNPGYRSQNETSRQRPRLHLRRPIPRWTHGPQKSCNYINDGRLATRDGRLTTGTEWLWLLEQIEERFHSIMKEPCKTFARHRPNLFKMVNISIN